jgi:hypothetical protein
MTSTETIDQTETLSERVMGMIGGYRMGAQLNVQGLFTKTAARATSPDTVPAPAGKND